jgi:hypothetical protein
MSDASPDEIETALRPESAFRAGQDRVPNRGREERRLHLMTAPEAVLFLAQKSEIPTTAGTDQQVSC